MSWPTWHLFRVRWRFDTVTLKPRPEGQGPPVFSIVTNFVVARMTSIRFTATNLRRWSRQTSDSLTLNPSEFWPIRLQKILHAELLARVVFGSMKSPLNLSDN